MMQASNNKVSVFFNAWFDSLKLFIPGNFKLFFLVTLKAALEAFSTLIRYFCPLLFVWALVELFNFAGWHYIFDGYLVKFLRLLLSFILFLTVRPSVKLKDYAYYFGYVFHFIGYVLFFGILSSLFSIYPIKQILGYGIFIPHARLFFTPFIVFFVFFYLDSNASPLNFIKSLGRSFIMFFYNYPFCLVAYLLCVGVIHFSYLILFFLLNFLLARDLAAYGAFMISNLLLPFVLAFIGNFYIKKVHDQFTLYMAGC